MVNMELASKLSSDNLEERNFLSFFVPSTAQLEDKSEFSEWCERMILINEDLKWLLSLPVLEFWNQVVYDPSWMTSLESFLQNCPRHFDLKNVPENCKAALSRVSRLYLLLIKRMSMHNEDEENQMPSDVFGDLIYENYLFDAPKLLDICAIFNRPDESVRNILMEILENVFHCQPHYYNDLSGAFESMVYTLEKMEEKVKLLTSGENSLNGRDAIDMMLFLYDMTSTIASFLTLFPKGCKLLFSKAVIARLGNAFETLIPALVGQIEVNQKKFKYVSSKTQKNILQILVDTIEHGFIARTGENSKEVNEGMTIEFISIMDSISHYKTLFARYCGMGTLSRDLEVIQKLNVIDMSNLEYLSNMVGVVVQENAADKTTKQLRELLPHKSEAFLQSCIAQYGSNTEAILNNVLEGNIEDQTIKKPAKKAAKPIPNKAFLEDNKEHVALVKLSLYNESEEGADYDNYDNYDNIYEDEYDDTYDSLDVGAADTDSVDELSIRRKFTVPRVLQQLNRANGQDAMSSEEDEDEEEDEEGREKNDQDFLRPPEELRRIHNNSRGRGGGGGRGRGSGGDGRGRGGGGRGRGTSRGGKGNKNRNIDRPCERKDEGSATNNASRGGSNPPRGRGRGRGRGGKHNRRVLADKKMSKGMF